MSFQAKPSSSSGARRGYSSSSTGPSMRRDRGRHNKETRGAHGSSISSLSRKKQESGGSQAAPPQEPDDDGGIGVPRNPSQIQGLKARLTQQIVDKLKNTTAEQQLRRFLRNTVFPNELIQAFVEEQAYENQNGTNHSSYNDDYATTEESQGVMTCQGRKHGKGSQTARFASLLVDVDDESIRQLRWLVGSVANSLMLQDANIYSKCLSMKQPQSDNERSSSQAMLTPEFYFLHDNKGVKSHDVVDFFRQGVLEDNTFVGVKSIMHCTSVCQNSKIAFLVFSPGETGECFECFQKARIEWDKLLLDRIRILHLDLDIPVVKSRNLIRRHGTISYHFAPLSEASKFVLYTDEELLKTIQCKDLHAAKNRAMLTCDPYHEYKLMQVNMSTTPVSGLRRLFRELHPYNRTHLGLHNTLHQYVGSFSDFCPLDHLVSQFADTGRLRGPEKGERKGSRTESSSSSVFHGYSLWHCNDGTMLRTPPTAAELESQWILTENAQSEESDIGRGSHNKESATAIIRFSKLTEYIHIKTLDSILHQGKRSYLVAQQMAKQGIPDHQRRKLWAVLLKSPRNEFRSAKGRYFSLLDDVYSLEYMTDDLVRADVASCCEEDCWFPFEKMMTNILMAWTRDEQILKDCTDKPHNPIQAQPLNNKHVSLQIPPSGILPFEQLGTLLAPLCYVTREEPQMYELWRTLYTRFWCRLSSISGKEDSLPFLCRQFEDLCTTLAPGLYMDLVSKGVYPLQLIFPLMRTAFASCLDARQTLLLWDRIIAFNSLKLLPICGVALLIYRGHELIKTRSMDEARELLESTESVLIIPLIQMVLFGSPPMSKVT